MEHRSDFIRARCIANQPGRWESASRPSKRSGVADVGGSVLLAADGPVRRGASWRSSGWRGIVPWDVKENLPLDYSRIFQFNNYNRKVSLEVDDGVMPATADCIFFYGLLPHGLQVSAMMRLPAVYSEPDGQPAHQR